VVGALRTLCALACLLLLGAVPAASAPPADPVQSPAEFLTGIDADVREETQAERETKRLHALFDSEWERVMKRFPTRASLLGDRRYNVKWTDNSLQAIEEHHRANRRVLERLGKIARSLLPPAEQLNYDLFKKKHEEDVAGHSFRQFLIPVGHRGGIQTADELHERLRFRTVKDFEDWIARLNGLGARVDQTIALMKKGIEEKIVPPRVIMERVPKQIAAQIVSNPDESLFYVPIDNMPASFDAPTQARLRAAAQNAIRRVVLPAYRKLKAFFNDTYLPACRETVGAWDHPGGPRFYFKDKQDLLRAYRDAAKRIDPELTKLFKRLPRMPYGVRPVPDAIAPDTTTAYYSRPAADGSRAGYFYVNLYKPEVRPKYEIEVLTAHEAVPGHHLQIALAQELGELPRFRRYGGFTAYIEGWGLYSESLGEELGLYQDPYSKFGQLTYEMWRAIRLVVDTGLHAFKWSRQRAIDYFKEHAAKTEHDIVNEIDRYIGWPGQALAYKIGELRIQALRRRAREKLGDRFDIRDFHDAVLGSGAVPLDILERNVDAYIQKGRE